MPAVNKVGTQLLMSPHEKARGQALAAVRQESVAEIWRFLIRQALPGMERAHAGQLEDLRKAFEHMGVDFETGVEAMLKNKIKFADLFEEGRPRDRFPAGNV
jgi:hypothetical protein